MRLVTTIEESSRALLAIRLGVIERNMRETNTQSLLVLVKAIGLSWETTRSIMTLAAKRYRRSLAGIDQAMSSFYRLRQSTAQQILDFHTPARPARSN